jgi:hypothetical protein
MSAPDEALEAAALIGGTDGETREVVERLLAEAGIDCFIEGSAVYAVQVRSRDLGRAREILASAAELEGRWIRFDG